MITKSPSRKTRLFPTGGCSAARLSLIHCLKLNACNGCIQCVLEALFAYVTRSKPTPRGLPVKRTATSAFLLAVLLAGVAGCSHMPSLQWPWHRKAPPPPQEVHELVITTPEGADAAFPQYWKGNILIVDLKGATGEGSVILKPREHTLWPVRIAFRVTPGQFGVLEGQATQRVDLQLTPGVFIMKTPQMTVHWGPAPADQSSGS